MAQTTPTPQQGGTQTPSQQPGQSQGAPAPQQGQAPLFKDWAAI